MVLICIKQHLINIRSSIYEKLSNTEAELKKSVVYKKTWPLFMDGVQLFQGYRPITKRKFTFYHSVLRNSWYSLIYLGRMKIWVDHGATQWYWTRIEI